MRVMLAAAAFAVAASASAQEPILVTPDTQQLNRCVWNEHQIIKLVAAPRAAEAPFSVGPREERTVTTSLTRFLRDGDHWLIAETYPGASEDTLIARFDATGLVVAAAYDQDSLERFAEATRSGRGPQNQEASHAAYGVYEVLIFNRAWSIGDPMFSAEQLQRWQSTLQAPNIGLLVSAVSELVFSGVETGADGRERLIFTGPIRFTGRADLESGNPAVWAITNRPEDLSLEGVIETRADFDRATGFLIEFRQTLDGTLALEGEISVRITLRATADCQSRPAE